RARAGPPDRTGHNVGPGPCPQDRNGRIIGANPFSELLQQTGLAHARQREDDPSLGLASESPGKRRAQPPELLLASDCRGLESAERMFTRRLGPPPEGP